MKRVLIIAAAFALLPLTVPAAQAVAWDLGGGLVYGSEIEQFGAQVNAYFPLWEKIRVGGDVTLYASDTDRFLGQSFETRLAELNVNGHYMFLEDPRFRVYGIGGVNLSRVRVSGDVPGLGRISETDTEVGLNVGAGAERSMGWGTLYGELKYVVSDFDQMVIGAGVRFPIGR